MANYYSGETVTFSVLITRQSDGTAYDPSSINISIIANRSNNTPIVDSQAMTKSAVGSYYYDWVADNPGMYYIIYTATDGSKVSIQKDAININ